MSDILSRIAKLEDRTLRLSARCTLLEAAWRSNILQRAQSSEDPRAFVQAAADALHALATTAAARVSEGDLEWLIGDELARAADELSTNLLDEASGNIGTLS